MQPGTSSENTHEARDRELFEWMLVRLLVIAERCQDRSAREELMRLVDQCQLRRRLQLDDAYAALNIVQDFIPLESSNRPGKRLVPTAITIHNTDNVEVGANAAAHANYLKSPDARKREVSWHFTVDDTSVYQSLPTNEIGWHTGSSKGNSTSIGVEICMNADLDVTEAYRRAALLTAVLAFQNGIDLPKRILQHHDWSEANCPRILRSQPHGWQDFLAQAKSFRDRLTAVPTIAIRPDKAVEHHLFE